MIIADFPRLDYVSYLMEINYLNELKFNKRVLLTGAGFTKDIGGFLAEEMWSLIFNSREIDSYPNVKNVLRKDFSYESVYHEILNGTRYADEEQGAMRRAMLYAYGLLDENIQNYFTRKDRKCSDGGVVKFINMFRGGVSETGFFFTLNQDLFVERYCRGNGLVTPGVPLQSRPSLNYPLNDSDYQRLSSNQRLGAKEITKEAKLHYIKLHGSYLWRDFSNNATMVIGDGKTDQIDNQPLLNDYFALFKQVLASGGVEFFVIGYGFNDEHINEIIVKSIESNSLKLYIMNPDSPKDFSNALKQKAHCIDLWDNISGYFPYSMSRVFPVDNHSIEYKQIRQVYLKERQ